jgi:putative membrane protein insertion efficiency factor
MEKLKLRIANCELRMIRFYQRRVSPSLPPMCRFYPTCSQYALESIEIHGALRGSLLALWRFLRCNPLFPGGYDPVPPKIIKGDRK